MIGGVAGGAGLLVGVAELQAWANFQPSPTVTFVQDPRPETVPGYVRPPFFLDPITPIMDFIDLFGDPGYQGPPIQASPPGPPPFSYFSPPERPPGNGGPTPAGTLPGWDPFTGQPLPPAQPPGWLRGGFVY